MYLYILLMFIPGFIKTLEGKAACPNKFCPLDMYCPHGVEVDEMGCVTCVCKLPPAETCPTQPRCHLVCVHGLALDSYGCTTCKCNENGFTQP